MTGNQLVILLTGGGICLALFVLCCLGALWIAHLDRRERHKMFPGGRKKP